ncbi:MAG: thiamine phosphate synthase [Sphingobium sp.]
MPRRQLPTLWLMTDERVPHERLLRAVARLPRGSGVVFRHYRLGDEERRALFGEVRRIARRRGLWLMLAGDERLALRWRADGVHGAPSRRLPWSASAHDRRELRAAERGRAALAFVSPLFATRSHPGARPLGVVRFAALARGARVPVMALGGVGRRHLGLIRMLGASGFGAIDSLTR